MRILYLYQYFGIPKHATSIRGYEFARYWREKGHEVTVLTTTTKFHSDPLITSHRKRLVYRIEIEGIDVVAFRLFYKQHMRTLVRMLTFLTFALAATLYGLIILSRFDAVYATSAPLTVGIPALVFRIIRKKPYVFEVRDQWPEVPIEIGAIRGSLLVRSLLWLEKTIYRWASYIVALSPGMARGVEGVMREAGIRKPVGVIPNSSDIELFDPKLDATALRERHHWQNKLVFLYAGSLGKVNYIDFLVQAAARLQDRGELHFVVIGFGSDALYLSQRIRELGLTNIEYLGPKPKIDLPMYFSASDVTLSIINNFPIVEHNSANKFFDSLAAGKPILLNYSGWQRDLLEENQAGYGCRLCDLDEFVSKIDYLGRNKGKLKKMGKNARVLAERNFPRLKLADQALRTLLSVVRAV